MYLDRWTQRVVALGILRESVRMGPEGLELASGGWILPDLAFSEENMLRERDKAARLGGQLDVV